MSEYHIQVNETLVHILETKSPDVFIVNGKEVYINALMSGNYHLHVIHKYNGFRILKEDENLKEKSFKLRINGKRAHVTVKTSKDLILEKMGFNNLSGSKVLEVKAPMPGLVLKLIAQAGQEVKKGENLLVLEAMKMENMIKSPGDGFIDEILVKPSQPVEKNQLMIRFK
jgi:biotin carboxyl carrier protein